MLVVRCVGKFRVALHTMASNQFVLPKKEPESGIIVWLEYIFHPNVFRNVFERKTVAVFFDSPDQIQDDILGTCRTFQLILSNLLVFPQKPEKVSPTSILQKIVVC